ncbi:hypothetical protein ACFE04_000512 [Oxalis oulophora]
MANERTFVTDKTSFFKGPEEEDDSRSLTIQGDQPTTFRSLVLALVLIASYTDDLEMEGLDPFGQIAISIPRSSSAGWIDKINGYWTMGLFLRCLINATGCWH